TKFGADRVQRIARRWSRSYYSSAHMTAQSRTAHTLIDIGNTFSVHLTNGRVTDFVRALQHEASVAYVSPDWLITTMNSGARQIPLAVAREAAGRAAQLSTVSRNIRSQSGSTVYQSALPSNFDVASNAQSFLGATGVNALSAYDLIAQ